MCEIELPHVPAVGAKTIGRNLKVTTAQTESKALGATSNFATTALLQCGDFTFTASKPAPQAGVITNGKLSVAKHRFAIKARHNE